MAEATTVLSLLEQECQEIKSNEKPLTDLQIGELKREIFSWDVIEKNGQKRLRRLYKFRSFPEALLFATQVGEKAEANKHHPRLIIDWQVTTVEWWTHDVGGLHCNDFIMAAKTDDVYDKWREITGRKDIVEFESEQSFPASDSPSSHVIEGADNGE